MCASNPIPKTCYVLSIHQTRTSDRKSSPRSFSPDKPIRIRSASCTRRVCGASSVRGRRPHRRVGRHLVGADSHCLNVDCGSRHLVCCHSTRSARRARDRAEEIAARAVRGHSNASSVFVALGQARLQSVELCLAAVGRVVRRAGEVLIAVDGVCGSACVSVVVIVVVRAESSGWGCSRRGR